MLRKARLLRGSSILITEDFPRRVREHRAELARFAKEVNKFDFIGYSLYSAKIRDASRKVPYKSGDMQ